MVTSFIECTTRNYNLWLQVLLSVQIAIITYGNLFNLVYNLPL
jgi:hypothetical protein